MMCDDRKGLVMMSDARWEMCFIVPYKNMDYPISQVA